MNMPYVQPPFELPNKRPAFAGLYEATELRKERRGILRVVTPIYRVRLISDMPLILHSSDGATYRTEIRFESDGGSIPPIVQTLRVPGVNVKRDSWLRAFFVHDNACSRKGLHIWTNAGWRFLAMSRAKVDWILRDALLAEGANVIERSIIYGAVRLYGRVACDW